MTKTKPKPAAGPRVTGHMRPIRRGLPDGKTWTSSYVPDREAHPITGYLLRIQRDDQDVVEVELGTTNESIAREEFRRLLAEARA